MIRKQFKVPRHEQVRWYGTTQNTETYNHELDEDLEDLSKTK